MRSAPEEPIAAVQPRLVFPNDPQLQESIAIDVAAAESAMADGRYKNACVMAGAAIEALLLWAVQRRPGVDHQAAFARVQANRTAAHRPGIPTLDQDPRRCTLEQYIEIARELQVLSPVAADASMLAREFRNLIHPGRAERLRQQATRGTAAEGVAALTLTTEDLAARAANQQL